VPPPSWLPNALSLARLLLIPLLRWVAERSRGS